ncbi:MAG: hypothetical protein WBY75_20205, partial [Terracidiphilus sp.]
MIQTIELTPGSVLEVSTYTLHTAIGCRLFKMLVPMKRFLLPSLLALLVAPAALAAGTVTALHDDWRMQSACKLQATGNAIASAGFSVDGWIKASVPSTVLAAQVAAGLIPDPYFGDNLRQIPGTTYPIGHNFSNLPMAADSPYRCGWWYRKEFSTPAASTPDARVWLHFGGINYRGEVWLNGHKVADSSTIAGAYR